MKIEKDKHEAMRLDKLASERGHADEASSALRLRNLKTFLFLQIN